jgi:hypothetical protein
MVTYRFTTVTYGFTNVTCSFTTVTYSFAAVTYFLTIVTYNFIKLISTLIIIMTCRHDEIWFLSNVFHLTNLATTTI